jgi:hypothetical protein
MIEDTETYYRRREREELDAADRSTDPVAAEIHRSLAARYSALNGHLRVLPSSGQSDIAGSTLKLNP